MSKLRCTVVALFVFFRLFHLLVILLEVFSLLLFCIYILLLHTVTIAFPSSAWVLSFV